MNNELKIAIAVGVMLIVFVNLTRVVWKSTETNTKYSEVQQIACLQGGGDPFVNGFGDYMGCEKKK